jgi:lactate permease
MSGSAGPVVILLGLSAIGASRRTGEVLRLTLLPAMVLLASAVTMPCVPVAVHP